MVKPKRVLFRHQTGGGVLFRHTTVEKLLDTLLFSEPSWGRWLSSCFNSYADESSGRTLTACRWPIIWNFCCSKNWSIGLCRRFRHTTGCHESFVVICCSRLHFLLNMGNSIRTMLGDASFITVFSYQVQSLIHI